MSTARPKPVIRLSIVLGTSGSLDATRIALLEHIEAGGSLSQAARTLGVSYRYAWLMLDELNHLFAEPVTTATIGGTSGGGMQLTALGKALASWYRALEGVVASAAQEDLSKCSDWLDTKQPSARPAHKKRER